MCSYLFVIGCLCIASIAARVPLEYGDSAPLLNERTGDFVPLDQDRADQRQIDERARNELKEEILRDLRTSIGSITPKPVAYLPGGYDQWVTYNSGQVITHWSNSTSGSLLKGGMTYKKGSIVVPVAGVYYIFFNLHARKLDPKPVSRYRYPSLYVDSDRVGFMLEHFVKSHELSNYFGMLWNVKKGGKISVRAVGYKGMQYRFGNQDASFGAWQVN